MNICIELRNFFKKNKKIENMKENSLDKMCNKRIVF